MTALLPPGPARPLPESFGGGRRFPAPRLLQDAGADAGTFSIRIGPACVALRGRMDPGDWLLDTAHPRFLTRHGQPDLLLDVRQGPSAAPCGRPAFRVGEVASFFRDDASWIIRLGEDDTRSGADRVVCLDASGATGSLTLDVSRSPDIARSYPLEYPLEDLLFRHLLATRQALLLHACGILWEGRGYLFIGSSGAGKSTTARLWEAAGAEVLNDDRTLLEARADGVWIHPTPWFGDHPRTGDRPARLAALYLLRRGDGVAFEPLRPAVAAAHLLAKSFPPLWDPDRMAKTLETLDRACRAVPCGWLAVPPDARAVAWVQAHA